MNQVSKNRSVKLYYLKIGFLYSLLLTSFSVHSDEILVAVASNFANTFEKLSVQYEKQSQHRVKIARGATGKLYAQIINGAPYHLFFSADKKRPQLLEQSQRGVKNSRKTYAYGHLALLSRKSAFLADGLNGLADNHIQHIAIANPKLAPYGKAARQVLQSVNWQRLKHKLVMGENIGQTFHFVASGAADAGIVAFSQVLNKEQMKKLALYHQKISPEMYAPVEQQYIVLRENAVTDEFIRFLKSDVAQRIILQSGYSLPESI